MQNKDIINCIIVDDEDSSQRVLQYFIAETKTLRLKQTCNNALEAFKYLELDKEVDLIFLDINMPKQSGLDFYRSIIDPPAVIFTTAYPQYAVEGFEVNATDYLLKPIAYERFLNAIHKLPSHHTKKNSKREFIILKENKALHKVYFKEILFAEAYGDYVKVQLANKLITIQSTFSGFLEQLPKYFIRTHKSFCINLNELHQLSANQIIIDSYSIPIGQTFKTEVLKALNSGM